MRLLLLLSLLFVAQLPAQTVVNLSSTHLATVCPPSNGGTGAGSAYSTYAFASYCSQGLLGAWGSCTADTKRNRLVCQGGGHSDYYGNELYALDLLTPSTTVATTCGANGCRSNPSVPMFTRLNDPSAWDISAVTTCSSGSGSPYCRINPDGTPVAHHCFGGCNAYLPTQDAAFRFEGTNPDGSDAKPNTLWFNLASLSWSVKDPVNGFNTNATASTYGASCSYDPVTDSVFCFDGSANTFLQYVPGTNTWTRLNSATGYASFSTSVIDPVRRQYFLLGGGSAAFAVVDISGNDPTYHFTSITSTTTGCSAVDSVPWPGAQYDPTISRIVLYPNSGNTVYLFDPGTYTCTPIVLTGATIPTVASNVANGTNGKFQYFPALNKFVLCAGETVDCYTFSIAPDATPGIGHSTITCIDVDGDGYGTGPGCTGADADDNDATVHSASDAITKYGTLAAFVKHLGYNPTRLWYLSTSGDDSTCAVGSLASPPSVACATWAHIVASVTAGDMVMFRAGTWNNLAVTPAASGTSGNPIIFMAYPGELPFIDNRPAGYHGPAFAFLSKSWIVLDGIKSAGGTTNAGCIQGGAGSAHITIRHAETTECTDGGVDAFDNLSEWNIEYNVMHDMATTYCNSCQHNLYMGSRNNPAVNIAIRRNLMYNAQDGYPSLQWNGRVKNLVIEQNVIYGEPSNSGIGLLEGVSNSRIITNQIFDNGGGITIANYDGDCYAAGSVGICPYDQTGNLIANNTVYVGKDPGNGGPTKYGFYEGNNSSGCYPLYGTVPIVTGTHAWINGNNYTSNAGVNNQPDTHPSDWTTVGSCTLTKQGNLGGNTFANNLFYAQTAPLCFNTPTDPTQAPWGGTYLPDAGDTTLANSTFINNVFWPYLGVDKTKIKYGPTGNCVTGVTLASLNAGLWSAASTGSVNADPLFIAASDANWATPGAYDLRLTPSSPAITAGAHAYAPTYDLIGTPYAVTSPSVGALQFLSTGGSVINGTVRISGATIH